MDFLTLIGLLGCIAMLTLSMVSGNLMRPFLNLHGFTIVVAGTLLATTTHCSRSELAAVARAFGSLFVAPKHKTPEELIPVLVSISRRARERGMRAIENAGAEVDDGGFMTRALDIAIACGEHAAALVALEREINSVRSRHREVVNIIRTMGTLSPMFGLLGTLLGIVGVLSNLTDIAKVGPAMAVAISSAFYGIGFSNMLCLPAAGKLRSRSLAEMLAREVTMVGVLDIVYKQRAPMVLEMVLQSYLQHRREETAQAAAGAAEPAPAA